MKYLRNPLKLYTEFFSALSSSYTKFVTPTGKGAYPIVDRIISYGLPTAGAVLWSVYGTHNTNQYKPFDKTGSYYGLPAGLAFYALSQVGLTYAKPYVEVKEDDSNFYKGCKKFASGGIEVLDILNNIVPYTIACNMLPETYGLNEVAAFRVMPAIIEGIESDITAGVNGTKYTPTLTGGIYSSTIAGFASVNLRNALTKDLATTNKDGDASSTKNTTANARYYANKSLESFVGIIIEAFSYPLIKKLFMRASYKPNEIEKDVLKSVTKDIFKAFADFEPSSMKDSVFGGILKFSAAECVPKALKATSAIIADFEIHDCDTTPELCENNELNSSFSTTASCSDHNMEF